ncbi:hypothetical protein PUN4_550153 [Paraburkholderia unamae]|nr:hypothetical protein PUN4_550153 [Paraburkholderia unamae]
MFTLFGPLHRLVWWSNRVAYVIERNGLALELPFSIALEVSKLIIGDESADRNRRG